jgi:hypothetical protein
MRTYAVENIALMDFLNASLPEIFNLKKKKNTTSKAQ